MGSNTYALPVVYLTLIYARVLFFVRRQSPQLARGQQGRRAQRDLIVARRILFLVNALILPVLPNVVFFLITSLNPSVSGSYYMYHLQWIGPVLVTSITSISLIFLTPKLKEIVQQVWKSQQQRVWPRVTTIHDQVPSGIQMAPIQS